jgi:FKBP-type peptidyl-prolyl cis-trans isomerase
MSKTSIIISVIVIILIVVGIYFLIQPSKTASQNQNVNQQPQKVIEQNQDQQSVGADSTNFDIQGMKVEILKQGTGDGAKVGDNIAVNYTGTLLDGTKFDSSVDPSFGHVAPFPYTLGQNRVIKGWELGLLGMKVGEKRKLTIPPELAYGPQGANGVIPPNATLVFEIDMVSINGK